jgi:hypothetical protein
MTGGGGWVQMRALCVIGVVIVGILEEDEGGTGEDSDSSTDGITVVFIQGRKSSVLIWLGMKTGR